MAERYVSRFQSLGLRRKNVRCIENESAKSRASMGLDGSQAPFKQAVEQIIVSRYESGLEALEYAVLGGAFWSHLKLRTNSISSLRCSRL